ncbi:MAG: hypothetical protein AAB722_00025 [Patescibacteria group bacterium]
MFNNEQLKVISGIFSGLGQVSIASIVLPLVFPSFSYSEVNAVTPGSVLSVLFWTLSILSVKNIQ